MNVKGWFSRYQLSTVSNLADVLVICTGLLGRRRPLHLTKNSIKTVESWNLENHFFLVPEPAVKPYFRNVSPAPRFSQSDCSNGSTHVAGCLQGVRYVDSVGANCFGCCLKCTIWINCCRMDSDQMLLLT